MLLRAGFLCYPGDLEAPSSAWSRFGWRMETGQLSLLNGSSWHRLWFCRREFCSDLVIPCAARPGCRLWLHVPGAGPAVDNVCSSGSGTCCLSAMARSARASYSIVAPGLQVRGLSKGFLVLY